MKLLVGLGNPGPQYETTRHNAGFLVLDLLAEAAGISWADESKRFGGFTGKGTILGETCILLKPMTFMNRSGLSVTRVLAFYKISPGEMVVLHDDIDIPSGKVKAREGGGAGGHNGIRSILDETGQSSFDRLKLGVGRPGQAPGQSPEVADGKTIEVHSWVLGKMTDGELIALDKEVVPQVQQRLKQIFERHARKA